jgi:hypothetical protein
LLLLLRRRRLVLLLVLLLWLLLLASQPGEAVLLHLLKLALGNATHEHICR